MKIFSDLMSELSLEIGKQAAIQIEQTFQSDMDKSFVHDRPEPPPSDQLSDQH